MPCLSLSGAPSDTRQRIVEGEAKILKLALVKKDRRSGLIRESVSIAQLLAKEEKLKLSASDEAIAKFWLKNILGDLDGVKTVEVDGFRGLIYITVGKDNAKRVEERIHQVDY